MQRIREKIRLPNLKIVLINLSVFIGILVNTNVVFGAEYTYANVGYLHDYLIKSDLGGTLLKNIGNSIYSVAKMLVDGCYDGYSALSNFNIMDNATIKGILGRVDTIVYAIFFIIFLFAVIGKTLKLNNPMKVLVNVFACFVAVTLFSSLLTMGNNFKSALMSDVDSLINGGDYKISETIYAENTVDCLKSLKQGKVVNLTAREMQYFDKNEVIKKDVLYDYPVVGTDGNVTYETFPDGVFGFGEIRYYRYNTDFWSVNCILISTVIVYLFAILKHGYLLIDWFMANFFGKATLGRGIFDMDKMSITAKAIVEILVEQVVLYTMMSLFTVYMSALMQADINFVAKCLLVYCFGTTVMVGSGFVNKALGMQDNFGTVMRGMFATRAMSRIAKKGGRAIGNIAKKGKEKFEDTVNDTYENEKQDYEDGVYEQMGTDEFKDAVNEDKEDYDIQQAKEKMQEKEYNDDIQDKAKKELYGEDYKVQEEKAKMQRADEQADVQEQAKKELYGDDYKVQEEKEKLQQADEKADLQDQAKKELYGEDYKVQEEKQKLQQANEKADLQDQAKKELYGEDYKVQEEKARLQQSDEHAVVTDQAKQELYGPDYKYNEVKQEVINGEEHAQLVDQAKEELHGPDYKEKQMRAQVQDSIKRQQIKEELLGGSVESLTTSKYDNLQMENPVDDEVLNELPDLLEKLKKGEL